MTQLDYLLWCYVECQVYKNNSQSIGQLKDEIVGVIDETQPQMYQNVTEKCNKRHLWSDKRYINSITDILIIDKKV